MRKSIVGANKVPLPKARSRADVHKHPLYYAVRNHIIDFLVTRSKGFDKSGHDPRNVPLVRPGAGEVMTSVAGDSKRVSMASHAR